MKIIGVIPARLGSTRLKEKVLAPLEGIPMIQHVWQRAKKAQRLTDLIVACDDLRVRDCVKDFGGKALMTRTDHPNGSSRVAEVAEKTAGDVFINIQGDEPLMPPEAVDQLAGVFEREATIEVATLAVRCQDQENYKNPNVVKVVLDDQGFALYFSRSPLPYYREIPEGPASYLKHLGIYGYKKNFLLQWITWPATALESAEKLEQLRILERGHRIRVIETSFDSWSVDTAQDLSFVKNKLKANLLPKHSTSVKTNDSVTG